MGFGALDKSDNTGQIQPEMPKADKLNGQNSMAKNESRTLLLLLVSLNIQKYRSSLLLFWKIRKIYYTLLVYISWIYEHQAVTVARRSYSANEPKLYCTKLNIVFRVWCLIAQCGNQRFLNLYYKWVYMSYRWTPVVLIELLYTGALRKFVQVAISQ